MFRLGEPALGQNFLIKGVHQFASLFLKLTCYLFFLFTNFLPNFIPLTVQPIYLSRMRTSKTLHFLFMANLYPSLLCFFFPIMLLFAAPSLIWNLFSLTFLLCPQLTLKFRLKLIKWTSLHDACDGNPFFFISHRRFVRLWEILLDCGSEAMSKVIFTIKRVFRFLGSDSWP